MFFLRISWATSTDSEDEALVDWGLNEPRWLKISRVTLNRYELEYQFMSVASPEEREIANAVDSETCLSASAYDTS